MKTVEYYSALGLVSFLNISLFWEPLAYIGLLFSSWNMLKLQSSVVVFVCLMAATHMCTHAHSGFASYLLAGPDFVF